MEKIYHRASPLLPFSEDQHKYLQMYFFINDGNNEFRISTGLRKSIVSQQQERLHRKNNLVRLCNTAIDMMSSDTHNAVIHINRSPAGEHVREFNAPTID